MTLKNKDGTVYKLRGPNPLMNDQADWDKSKINLINIGWKHQVVHDDQNPIEKAKEGVFDIGEELKSFSSKAIPARDFINEINEEIKPQEPPVLEELDVHKEIVLDVDYKTARVMKERGVEFYCAPVIGQKQHRDDFYDNGYTTPEYGEQFVFDAIIVDQSDLQIQFWCVKPIPVMSIIYRKVKDGGERWWRVQSREDKTGGWLVLAHTSDVNPDFS